MSLDNSSNSLNILSVLGLGAIISVCVKYFADYRVHVKLIRAAANIIAGEIEANRFLTQQRDTYASYKLLLDALQKDPKITFPKVSMVDIEFDPLFKSQMDKIGFFPDYIVSHLVLFQNYKLAIKLLHRNLADGLNSDILNGTLDQVKAMIAIYEAADPIGQVLIIELRDFAKVFGHPIRSLIRKTRLTFFRIKTKLHFYKLSKA